MSLTSLVQTLTELPEATLVEYVDARQTEDCSAESLIILCAALRDAIEDLRAIKKRIEADVFAETDWATVQVPELGPVKVGNPPSWIDIDWQSLIPRVIAAISDEPGVLFDSDGERLPTHEMATRLTERLHECIGFGYMKKGGLEKRGIDRHEFARSKRTPTVSLPKRVI